MSEHTPGPWMVEVEDATTAKVYSEDRACTITVSCPWGRLGDPDQSEIIARLIAAAPDMLQALEELLAEADNPVGWEGHPHSDTTGFQFARDAVKKARA